jgi:hypothetical protein
MTWILAGAEEQHSPIVLVRVNDELQKIADRIRICDLYAAFTGSDFGVAQRLQPTVSVFSYGVFERFLPKPDSSHAAGKPDVGKNGWALAATVFDSIDRLDKFVGVGAPAPIAPVKAVRRSTYVFSKVA